MNIIYIIFIIIILFSFITGIFVTVVENREKKKYKDILENEEEILEEDNRNYNTASLPNSSSMPNDVESTNNDYKSNINNNSNMKLDDIEVLDNTIKLDFVPNKITKKNNSEPPKLVPYSVVDDDII